MHPDDEYDLTTRFEYGPGAAERYSAELKAASNEIRMDNRRRIQKRILDRARQVLQPIGQWPKCKHLVHEGAIAQRLAATLPGALADYDIDHRKPLAQYDLEDMGQVAEAFAASNHQWLRSGVNRRKGAR